MAKKNLIFVMNGAGDNTHYQPYINELKSDYIVKVVTGEKAVEDLLKNRTGAVTVVTIGGDDGQGAKIISGLADKLLLTPLVRTFVLSTQAKDEILADATKVIDMAEISPKQIVQAMQPKLHRASTDKEAEIGG
jgi:hypothetical protein